MKLRRFMGIDQNRGREPLIVSNDLGRGDRVGVHDISVGKWSSTRGEELLEVKLIFDEITDKGIES